MLTNLEEISNSEQSTNLKLTFPQPFRAVIRRSVIWLLVYLAFTIRILIWMPQDVQIFAEINTDTVIYQFSYLIILIGGLICAIKLIYEIIYQHLYTYTIEDGNLVISEGVFLKQRGMFPITSLRDVYLDRKFLDFIFGLYNLHLSNVSSDSHSFGDIKGLSPKSAVGFQDYLKRLLVVVSPANSKIEKIDPEDFKIEESMQS